MLSNHTQNKKNKQTKEENMNSFCTFDMRKIIRIFKIFYFVIEYFLYEFYFYEPFVFITFYIHLGICIELAKQSENRTIASFASSENFILS